MHDNTLARALSNVPGIDCILLSTYTPIRTDEEDVSQKPIFLGGITVYLQQKVPLFKYLPSPLVRWLDQPWLIRWLASRFAGTDAKQLGALTISMLKGRDGNQRQDVDRLCNWLADELHPNVIILSNMLIAGCVPELKRRIRVPVLVTLQGDDIFIDALAEPHRGQALKEIEKLVPHVDGFLVNSQYYADFMADYLKIPLDRIRKVPLGIDVTGFPAPTEANAASTSRPPTVGYLARLAPEKGLHVLVDAFLQLRQMPGMERAQLKIAGWLGDHQRQYAEQQFAKLRAANVGDDWQYCGSINRQQKIEFLQNVDVVSVPTTYLEPKGLYVLEALAAGVPVVQPAHGAFPELVTVSGGGKLVPSGDTKALAIALDLAKTAN
jgi:glycosyltransferase involved in cell wall biosynthesis